MEFTKKEITKKVMLEYAIKGIENDIENIDKKIQKGKKYINDRLEGKKADKSPLSIEELKSKVYELEIKKTSLESMKNDIKWDLTNHS